MIELEIDGQSITVEDGATIIEAADKMGIYIPRFCYHKKLSIAANCRMCLVEVEKSGKPLPACATPVSLDMKVKTTSQKALEAQRAVMEYLLINHPLDCPICDQGGECDLQDLSEGFGGFRSFYNQPKRSVFNEDIGPLIDTEMTRCIHCTRCVRFGEEIAGMPELGVTYRGEHMEIGTYVKHMMQSELSGNVIDLCPVGALTSKPFAYHGRGWEMREHPSIAVHDCVGSNIYIHTRGKEFIPQREVMRVVPRPNESINELWISDRDRFSYQGLNHSDRVLKPLVKRKNQWQELDWQSALNEITDRTQEIIKKSDADQIAAIVSPNASVEECYLMQKWLRALGGVHIDHRLRMQNFADQNDFPNYPNLGMKLADIEHLSTILLIGSNVRQEQPLINHRVYKAYKQGAKIMLINPMDYSFNFLPNQKIISDDLCTALAEIAAVLTKKDKNQPDFLKEITPSEGSLKIAQTLQENQKTGLFLGEYALNHPQAHIIRKLVTLISQSCNLIVGYLTEGANSAGAWLAGAIPHRGPAGATIEKTGCDAKTLFTTQKKKIYFLLGVEPEFDSAYSAQAIAALQEADLVVCLSTFLTPEMQKYADFILPITAFTETMGSYVNIEGQWQTIKPVSIPYGQAKPAWKVMQVLAKLMHLAGFDYENIHSIQEEIENLMKQIPQQRSATSEFKLLPNEVNRNNNSLLRLAPWPIYRVDPLVRRAQALQATMGEEGVKIEINQKTAEKLGLKAHDLVTAIQMDSSLTLPLMINDRIADNLVLLPSGLDQTAGFGQASMAITLQKGDEQ